jgi:hypothetical protein
MRFTHQTVGGQGRQTMLLAEVQTRLIRHPVAWRVIEQILLHPTEACDQAKIISQRVAFGEPLKAISAQGEEAGRWLMQKRQRKGPRLHLDFFRFENLTQSVILSW